MFVQRLNLIRLVDMISVTCISAICAEIVYPDVVIVHALRMELISKVKSKIKCAQNERFWQL